VCLGLCNRGHCLCNSMPTLKHYLLPHNERTWSSIDVTYCRIIDGRPHYEWMYICKNHINMQNLDGENISCIDGSENCGTSLAVARMAKLQGRNLVPVAGEVRHHSPYLKKLKKKLPNKYRTSYKFHAIYWRNIYKMCQDNMCQVNLNILHRTCWHIIYFNNY
jgi:hypothetical protein